MYIYICMYDVPILCSPLLPFLGGERPHKALTSRFFATHPGSLGGSPAGCEGHLHMIGFLVLPGCCKGYAPLEAHKRSANSKPEMPPKSVFFFLFFFFFLFVDRNLIINLAWMCWRDLGCHIPQSVSFGGFDLSLVLLFQLFSIPLVHFAWMLRLQLFAN